MENLIRIGRIEEITSQPPRARVRIGELLTHWLPWTAARAGDARTWWRPSIDELVMILSPGGDLEKGIIVASLYYDDLAPPDYEDSSAVTLYPDGTRIEVQPSSGTMKISGVKQLSIVADKTIIKSTVEISGSVTQSGGNMTSNGVVVHTHVHGGVRSGGSTTLGPS